MPLEHTPRWLSAHEIDAVVEVLRAEPGKRWVSRGRGGDGLEYREGSFYRWYFEEEIEEESVFADEAAFRAFLAGLDVATSAFSNRYWRWIVQDMGVIER